MSMNVASGIEDSQSTPLFSKQLISYRPRDRLTHLVACNNVLLLMHADRTLLRIFLQRPNDESSISIGCGASDSIAYVHADPTGTHCIVSTQLGDVFYIHHSADTAKPIRKIKGRVISAVGWNHEQSSEESTGFIVLGTSTGALLETVIKKNADIQYVKPLYIIPPFAGITPTQAQPSKTFFDSGSDSASVGRQEQNQSPCIRSVCLHKCASGNNRWMLLAATPGQLHPFAADIGNPESGQSPMLVGFDTLANLAGAGQHEPAKLANLFLDAKNAMIKTLDPMAGEHSTSELRVYPCVGDDAPEHFAWLTDQGVLYGTVNTQHRDAFKILAHDKLFSLRKLDAQKTGPTPIGLCLSEFHLLLLFPDRLVAVSTLNERCMFEDSFGTQFGRVVCVSRDPVSGIVWVCTENNVFRYRPDNEAKYVWQIYLSLGDFERARKYAFGNEAALDAICSKQAEQLLTDKRYTAAAELFALTSAPFEQTALRFVQLFDENERARQGLRCYLEKRLDRLAHTEKVQQTILVMWLVEILLTELGSEAAAAATHISASVSVTPFGHPVQTHLGSPVHSQTPPATDNNDYQTQRRLLRDSFRVFVNRQNVIEVLHGNQQAVYKLIRAHGDTDSLLIVADAMKDYDTLIALHIQRDSHEQALQVLIKADDSSLYHKHSVALLDVLCERLVTAWMHCTQLTPSTLLPIMFTCANDQSQTEHIMRYVEYCIREQHCTDQAVHNFLLSLYAKYSPAKLLQYLKTNAAGGQQCADWNYVLRLCTDKGLTDACVYVYSALGLHEEAVDLALKCNKLSVAKQCAQAVRAQDNTSHDDNILAAFDLMNIEQTQTTDNPQQTMRKQLWMKIAKHVVSSEADVSECMALLKESNGLLKIHDLLPFFPEFATIDHFKDSLCECLKEHSGRIKQLQSEMKEAVDDARLIKQDMQQLKNRYCVVNALDACGGCGSTAMARAFYAFPCRHVFHTSCIQQECAHALSSEILDEVDLLKRTVLNAGTQPNTDPSAADKAQLRLDDILGAKCPWCSDIAVELIDIPFYTPAQYKTEMGTWQIK